MNEQDLTPEQLQKAIVSKTALDGIMSSAELLQQTYENKEIASKASVVLSAISCAMGTSHPLADTSLTTAEEKKTADELIEKLHELVVNSGFMKLMINVATKGKGRNGNSKDFSLN